MKKRRKRGETSDFDADIFEEEENIVLGMSTNPLMEQSQAAKQAEENVTYQLPSGVV